MQIIIQMANVKGNPDSDINNKTPKTQNFEEKKKGRKQKDGGGGKLISYIPFFCQEIGGKSP